MLPLCVCVCVCVCVFAAGDYGSIDLVGCCVAQKVVVGIIGVSDVSRFLLIITIWAC